MDNRGIPLDDLELSIRKVDSKLSEQELAKLIYDEEALLYVDWGFTEKPISWQNMGSATQEKYTKIARVVLDKFYHRIPSYPEGVPTHQGYMICDMNQGVSSGISVRKLKDIIRQETGIAQLLAIALSVMGALRI